MKNEKGKINMKKKLTKKEAEEVGDLTELSYELREKRKKGGK